MRQTTELKLPDLPELADKDYWFKQACLLDPEFFLKNVLGLTVAGFHREMIGAVKDHDHILVLGPADHGKSTVLTVGMILHRLINNPNLRVLIISKGMDMPMKYLAMMREAVAKPRFKELFGDWEKGRDWSKSQITIPRTALLSEPTIKVLSTGSSIPGYHFDLIDADDLCDVNNSMTEGQRRKLWDWFRGSLLSRDVPGGSIWVLGTRFHADDLYGSMLTLVDRVRQEVGEEIWFVVHRKAIIDEDKHVTLWPERWSYERLVKKRFSMGSVGFGLMYQCEGLIGGKESLVKPHWISYFDHEPSYLFKVGYVDLAFSDSADADFFALCVIAMGADGNFYVDRLIREHLTPLKQMERVVEVTREEGLLTMGVESVLFQSVVARHLQATTTLPITAEMPKGSKTDRLLEILNYLEQGRIRFRRHGQEDAINELKAFPNGKNDDAVDALTGATALAIRYGDMMMQPTSMIAGGIG